MLHMLFWIDPVSPVLDAKQIGLTLVSVLLFIGSVTLQIAINNKLQTLSSDLDEVKGIVESNGHEMNSVKGTCEALKVQVEDAGAEAHEQWGKLNDLEQNVRENALRMADVKASAETISHQLTILATAQLSQQQQTQKVIDSLIDVLQDHLPRN